MIELLERINLTIEQLLVLAVFVFFTLKKLLKQWRRGRKPSVRDKDKFRPRTRTARVKNILDGDTVVVSNWLSEETIRLDAIDCPENGQPWGKNAKIGLIKLIGGRSVRVEEQAIDKYGRVVANLHVWEPYKKKWVDVNARMVVCGHAWVYRDFCSHLPHERRKELDRMENWAKRKRVGLWRHANPIPPWKWRNGSLSSNVSRIY